MRRLSIACAAWGCAVVLWAGCPDNETSGTQDVVADLAADAMIDTGGGDAGVTLDVVADAAPNPDAQAPDAESDASQPDAQDPDAGSDASQPDAQDPDAGSDASQPDAPDTTPDAPDTTSDAPDTTPDAPDTPDAIEDVAPDAIADASTPDASPADVPAPPDTGPPDAAPDAPTGLPDGPSSDRHTARELGSTSAAQGYWEYLPPGYGDGQTRPLLVFFHGLGENGNGTTDLPDVTKNGPPKIIKQDNWPSDRPFIVLSPQHPGGGCHSPGEIKAFLNHAMITYDVDVTRIYLTGLSCGGIGIWNYLGNETDSVVAAAVPICGDGKGAWNKAGCDLGNVALWAFHGDADNTVDVSGTDVPIDNLLSQCTPAKEVKKTIYPGVGHNSWSQTYNLAAGHDIYAWLLEHENTGVTPPPPPSDEPLAVGRTASIDFGDVAGAGPWNSISDTIGAAVDVVDDMGTVTQVDVVTSAFTGKNTEGVGANTLGYPQEVSGDTFWQGSFTDHADALTVPPGVVVISGLDPASTYDLVMMGSRTGNDGGLFRLTRYTIDGVSQDLEASDNASEVVTFSGVSPNGNGDITLTVEVSPAGTGKFAYINLLEITNAGP